MQSGRLLRAPLLGIVAIGLVSLVFAPPPTVLRASSHRDAPLITEDPTADNTDVYAFVSTEQGRSDFVTLIANWIPFEEPTEGPNYYRFSDFVRYRIAVVVNNNGRLVPALTYEFSFRTQIANGNTFLYNTGPIGAPSGSNPTTPYTNLNMQQSFTLTEVRADGARTVLLRRARVAPWNIGPKSTPNYLSLVNAAIHTVPDAGGMRVFAGPRAEMFFVDLIANFDLFNFRSPGVNSTAGFNVHTIALEIPKARLDGAGAHGIIGVWASSSRLKAPVLRGRDNDDESDRDDNRRVQVSRLGNPLVNEVLIPLKAKDRFNATTPFDDDHTFADFIVNPGSSQGPAALIPLINGVTGCTAVNGRADLQAVLLTGIPAGVVTGFPGNFTGARRADLLRLNYTIPPANVDPNNPGTHRLGLLAGDNAGFPNGRRVFDDVTDIALKAAAGVLQPLVNLPACAAAAGLTENVAAPQVPILPAFPYLGTPLQGFAEKN